VEAACKALRDGHHGYTPANGIPQVREAVAANSISATGSKSIQAMWWWCRAAR